jgi:hypothetical protein
MPDIQWLMEHINGLKIDTKLNIKYAEFELYGYNTVDNTAGFIKDFNFKTELSPAMSTMITVGATANGTVVGENATALSRLNNGYTDRFKPFITGDTSKLTPISALIPAPTNQGFKIGNLWEGVDTGRSLPTPPPPPPNTATDVWIKLQQEYRVIYNNFIAYLIRLSTWKFTSEEISTYKDALTNYNNAYAVYKKGFNDFLLALNNQDPVKNETMQPSTGFIPFNLSLTMDGLSGMKVNSKFLIDTSYLPSNYPETVDFLIKGLSHKIEGNKWETMLESYCISKGEYEESTQIINPQGQTTTTNTTNTTNSTSFNVTPTYLNLPKKALIDKYGWPIILDGTNPFTSKVISQNGGRNVYAQNPDYIKNNIVPFNYKGYNLKVHKISVDPLKKVIDLLDAQKLLPFTKIDASIYTRDTTGSPGDLSGHSFGISLDVNSAQFAYGNPGYIKYINALANSKDPNHLQARAIKVLVDSKLFNWGGNFSGTKDTHHFTIKPYNI